MVSYITIKKSSHLLLLLFCIVFSTHSAFSLTPIDGTTGTPLGGVGCGGIRFKAHDGTFTATFMSPCALEDFKAGQNHMGNTAFQLYTKRDSEVKTSEKLSAVITSGRADDDAIYPLHLVNFGTTNDVSVTMTAFSPFEFKNVDRMCYPYAFYQFKLTNTQSSAVEAAVAFQTETAEPPTYVSGKGMKNGGSGLQFAIYAKSDDANAQITAGNDNGFFTSGECNNSPSDDLNKVAVKVSLGANESKLLKFVFAWYNAGDPERFFYANAFSDAGTVADSGLALYDQLRDNALTFVNRMRASNFPDWMTNQALTTLCNYTTNSMYAKDGRYAHTEGMWNTNGTMDQMWHNRQIYAATAPYLVWQELKYWARTQKTDPEGQIHHDLGGYGMEKMCAWDDKQHVDYRTIDKWVDLNCAFIISVYEVFIATADKTELDWFWPYVKKAAQRIIDQDLEFGSSIYPNTFDGSQSSYDYGGESNPYNSLLAIITYKIMSILAGYQDDATLQQTYSDAYTVGVDSFNKRWLTSNFPQGRISEGVMSGQWLSYFLKLGDMFPQASLEYALESLNGYYYPEDGLGFLSGTYDEWSVYLISHYGGLLYQTGRQKAWRGVQFDWYERNFLDRDFVFNQELGIPSKVTSPKYLATVTSVYNQYISLPVLWRTYYDAVGFHRNKHTKELWLTPIIPDEMNHEMKDAFISTPEGFCTVSSTESGTDYKIQTIKFKPDNPMEVTNFYFRDKGLDTVIVAIDWIIQSPQRIGSGYAKEIKVPWNQTVPGSGITIIVTNKEVAIEGTGWKKPDAGTIITYGSGMIRVNAPHKRAYTLSVYSLDGRLAARRSGTGHTIYRLGSQGGQSTLALNSGTYIFKINTGTHSLLKTLVITR